MSQEALIETVNLTKIYLMGQVQVRALQGISLRVREGEFVAVMGPSGSGKSTLLNLLGCLDCPTTGSYYLEGKDVAQLADNQLARIRNRRIGFVFQTFNLLPRLSALRNVELPILYGGEGIDSKRATEVLERVGLGERLNHTPSELSGGERQRVAIARALVNDPAIILADEPTGNLDSITGAEIITLLRELNEEGRTILLVTHEEEIGRQAHRLLWLRDGHLAQEEVLR